MSQGRSRPGSAGRLADSSPKALIRSWYEAFVADTLHNYPSIDEFPSNFTDFDYVWSTFQTSNRKLRGTVVELIDFERESVLEYLCHQFRVLDFDNDKETIVWHPEQLEMVTEDKPPVQRRPWSQATHDWGAPKPATKDRSDADELFWGDSPSTGPVDPAWKIDWAGEAAASQASRAPQSSTPKQSLSDRASETAPRSSLNNGSRPSLRASGTNSGHNSTSRDIKPLPRPRKNVDDNKKRMQTEQQRRPTPKLSSGVMEPPPQKKRPVKSNIEPTPRGTKPSDWASMARKQTPKESQKQEASTTIKARARENKEASKPATAQATAVTTNSESKKTSTALNKVNTPAVDADEPPKWKEESAAKKGSGMALLGFDYL